jgi:hypothetical protein
MAEQNILAGDLSVLSQVRGDIKEYEGNRDKLKELNQLVSNISRSMESLEKSVSDEVEDTVKKRRDDVSAGYDNAIAIDKDKIKQVQADRDKAKSKGIQERIAVETADLQKDNMQLHDELNQVFREEGIPRVCNGAPFMTLFFTKGIRQVLISILVYLVLYVLVPMLVVVFAKGLGTTVLAIMYCAWTGVGFLAYRLVNGLLVLPNAETLQGARVVRKKISDNTSKIKKIRRAIRKDTSEEMYGLESFDEKLGKLYGDVERIEGERSLALEEFDNSTKPDIVAEIEGRDREKLEKMKADLERNAASLAQLQDKVKQQKIYITSNYEAYLGNEFMSVQKLNALIDIMKTTNVKTIGQAIMVYNERK